MSTLLTKGITTLTPLALTGYALTRPTRNVKHDIIGTPIPDITYADAGLRSGTLEFLFGSLAEAQAADSMFSDFGYTIMSDTDRDDIELKFVADGNIAVELAEDRIHAFCRVDVQEVTL
jgi:hypothetical protein